MRWSYIISRLTILAVIWAALFFGMDPAIKWGMRKGLQAAAGAKADIGRVHTTIFPPTMTISDLALANKNKPMENIFEFKTLRFKLRGRPLLEKKFIIEDASLEGLRLATKRKTSGALPAEPKTDEKPTIVSKQLDKIKAAGSGFALDRFSAVKGDALKRIDFSAASVETLRVTNELKTQLPAQAAETQAKIKALALDDKIKAVQEKMKAFDAESNPLNKLALANDIKKQLADIKSSIDEAKKLAEQSASTLKSAYAKLEQAKKDDIRSISDRLKLPATDPASLTAYLLGPAVSSKVETASAWYQKSKQFMPSSSEKIAPPKRAKGISIQFPKKDHYPSFAIDNMALTGTFEFGGLGAPLDVQGALQGITTQPKVYGRPFEAKLAGQTQGRAVSLLAEMDRTTDMAKDSFSFSADGFPAPAYSFGTPGSVEIKTDGGTAKGSGEIKITGGDFSGNIRAALAKPTVKVSLPAEAALFSSALEKAFASVKEITVEIAFAGGEMDLKSNVGQIASDAVKSALGQEIEKQKAAIEARINEETQKAKKELEDIAAKNAQSLTGETAGAQKSLDGISSQLKEKLSKAAGGIKLPKFSF